MSDNSKGLGRYGHVLLGFDIYDYLKTHRSTTRQIANHFGIHRKTVIRYLETISMRRPLYIVNDTGTKVVRYNGSTARVWAVLQTTRHRS